MIKPTDTIGDDIRLYRGDCREVMASLADGEIDAVVTDPPYGIGRDGMRESTSSHGGRKAYEFRGWDNETPTEDDFRQMFRVSRHQIIWGANYFTKYLPPSMGWLYWDKGQEICSSDGELAFTSMNKALRSLRLNRCVLASDGAVHPTQKPVKLMRWSLKQLPDGCRTILDPYMGSGSTGIAAAQLGLRFIGIEKEPAYYATALRRLTHAAGKADDQLFSVIEGQP